MRFHFTGFNVILGSHYDEYIFDYMKVETTLEGKAPECFAIPEQMMCAQLETDDGDDGGGGPTAPRPITTPDRKHHHLDAILPRADGANKHAASAKKERFGAWKDKHGKKYENEQEETSRAALFHATETYVNSMNRRHLSYWLGVNHMADWTSDERKKLLGRKHTPKGHTVDATYTHETKGMDTEDVDWRDAGAVTPPKDQGTCGSCWSFGATGTTEGQLFLKTGVLTPLSQQNLMDCSWSEGNDACDGGLDSRAYEWMLKHNGNLATESSYPYLNSDNYCRASSTTVGAQITGYVNITDGLDGLNDALATIGPISVSIDAEPNSFYFYQGGLYYDADCLSGMDDLDHTVLAVGYGE
jgi:C1A family cysteine protease